MDYLEQLISNLTQNPERLRLVFIVAITISVFIVVMGVVFLVSGATDPLQRRMKKIAEQGDRKQEDGHFSEKIAASLESIKEYITPKKDSELSKVRTKLINAGFQSPQAVTVFFAIKTSLAILGLLGVVLAANLFLSFTLKQTLMYAAVAFFIGSIMPNMVLTRLVEKRQKALRRGFPDSLDLLVVCTEAGLGLNAALQRVAEELSISHPALAQELALVNAEIRAGIDRSVAFNNLNKRTGLTDIRGLVAALSQTMRFGTSIADTLRIYAAELRDKRMQRAEEEAAKIGTKMTFPLILFLWPGFFVIMVGPAIMGVLDLLKK